MQIACLWVSELSLVAALRAEPRLCAEALAVVQAGRDLGGRAHVLGATPGAQGVARGQTLAEARAVCPRLVVRETSPERERAAAQAAREAAAAVSPRVEEAAPGLVYLDVSGLESLIGDARAVGRELVAAAERVGVRAAVGLGSSKSVARLAARAAGEELSLEETRWGVGGGAFRVVAPGEQREFLAALPLQALDLPDELHDSLRRFGLHTLGEVAALPPGPLAARLGPEAALLSRLARGEDGSALAARGEPERFEEGEELDWDASSLEPLLFLWKGLLDRLAQRLSARGLMARELLLQLRLADGSWDERALDLAAPTREVPALLQLLRLCVEGRPPSAGVRAVRLCALATREVLEQMPLFGPRGASPLQLAAAVARLSALVGPDRVGRPQLPDRWDPFALACGKFAPPPPPRVPAGAAPDLPLATRALRPPRTAEVRCDEAGAPLLVIGEGALGGRVVASAGPWRTVAEWWTEAPLALDAWDLELAGGLLVRAARELATGTWRIEAVYD
ncbi:MAG TPA: DNA polymerase Y family protein [Myxococcales bacterium]|nr:DNA polymerase Y family protein [Myxococcales bacterium]